jgi:hypothetical protein
MAQSRGLNPGGCLPLFIALLLFIAWSSADQKYKEDGTAYIWLGLAILLGLIGIWFSFDSE